MNAPIGTITQAAVSTSSTTTNIGTSVTGTASTTNSNTFNPISNGQPVNNNNYNINDDINNKSIINDLKQQIQNSNNNNGNNAAAVNSQNSSRFRIIKTDSDRKNNQSPSDNGLTDSANIALNTSANIYQFNNVNLLNGNSGAAPVAPVASSTTLYNNHNAAFQPVNTNQQNQQHQQQVPALQPSQQIFLNNVLNSTSLNQTNNYHKGRWFVTDYEPVQSNDDINYQLSSTNSNKANVLTNGAGINHSTQSQQQQQQAQQTQVILQQQHQQQQAGQFNPIENQTNYSHQGSVVQIQHQNSLNTPSTNSSSVSNGIVNQIPSNNNNNNNNNNSSNIPHTTQQNLVLNSKNNNNYSSSSQSPANLNEISHIDHLSVNQDQISRTLTSSTNMNDNNNSNINNNNNTNELIINNNEQSFNTSTTSTTSLSSTSSSSTNPTATNTVTNTSANTQINNNNNNFVNTNNSSSFQASNNTTAAQQLNNIDQTLNVNVNLNSNENAQISPNEQLQQQLQKQQSINSSSSSSTTSIPSANIVTSLNQNGTSTMAAAFNTLGGLTSSILSSSSSADLNTNELIPSLDPKKKSQDSEIHSRIELAMDIVKSHLTLAVKGEIVTLKNQINQLNELCNRLEQENQILRQHATPETLKLLESLNGPTNGVQVPVSNSNNTSTANGNSNGNTNYNNETKNINPVQHATVINNSMEMNGNSSHQNVAINGDNSSGMITNRAATTTTIGTVAPATAPVDRSQESMISSFTEHVLTNNNDILVNISSSANLIDKTTVNLNTFSNLIDNSSTSSSSMNLLVENNQLTTND